MKNLSQALPPGGPAAAPDPAPADPQDSIGSSAASTAPPPGIDLSKASKLVTFKNENLAEMVTLWKLDAQHYDTRMHISATGHYYEAGGDGTLRRLAQDGTVTWEKEVDTFALHPVVAHSGAVAVSSMHALEMYDPDGALRSTMPAPGYETDQNCFKQTMAMGPDGSLYVHDGTRYR